MFNSQEKSNSPFHKKPQEEKIAGVINTFESIPDNDDVLLRKDNILYFLHKIHGVHPTKHLPASENEIANFSKEAVALAAKSNSMVEELRNKYGLTVPKFLRIIGKDQEGKIVVYTIVEKIHGENIIEKDWNEEEKAEIAAQMEKELLSLLEYFKNKYEDKSEFLMDIARVRQFMYGTKKGDESPHVYMVDIEAYPSKEHDLLIKELRYLYLMFKALKEHLETAFPIFEKKFVEFAGELPEKDYNHIILDETRELFFDEEEEA
ncbi:MAG: hypothetical protein WA060_01485 [Minisyncoccia bacterium]